MIEDRRCVVCPVYRPSAQPRLYEWRPVCNTCRARVRAELTEIPDLYALIPDSLEPGTGTGVKVSGTRSPPIPLNINAVSLLVAAVGDLHVDTPNLDHMADQHGPVPPVVVLDLWVRDWIDVRAQGEHEPVPTISTLTGWLLNRLDWALDEHNAIDEFCREVNLTLRAIRSVVQAERQGEPVGRCPALMRDDSRCNARLYADPYLSMIQCGRCGTSWAREQWLHLAAQQEDARDEGAAA